MKLGTKLISALIVVIIVLIILMSILAETATDLGTSADNLTTYNATGQMIEDASYNDASTTLPLLSFFKKKGVVFLVLMAGIALAVIMGLLKLTKTGK